MKTDRAAVVTSPRTPPPDGARHTLRAFAAFTDTHDAAALAGAATDVQATLAAATRLERWLSRYLIALRMRLPQ